jgi:hypothetical protein
MPILGPHVFGDFAPTGAAVLQADGMDAYSKFDAYNGCFDAMAGCDVNNGGFQSRPVRHRNQGNSKRGQPRSNHPPIIKARSFPCCTQAVLHFLRTEAKNGLGYSLHYDDLGWKSLQQIWNIIPANLDSAALSYLHMKPHYLQQHILLTLCTTNLGNVKNLSAFMSCVVHKLETPFPVCLGFLAGCCEDAHCNFLHPVVTTGWKNLWERWQVGWQDFDYLVLNSLFQKTTPEQEDILEHLANMKLKNINNLSALLSSVIQQHDKNHNPSSRRRPKANVPRQAPPPQAPILEEISSPIKDTRQNIDEESSKEEEIDPTALSFPCVPLKANILEDLAAEEQDEKADQDKIQAEIASKSATDPLDKLQLQLTGLLRENHATAIEPSHGEDEDIMSHDTINWILESANTWLVGFHGEV